MTHGKLKFFREIQEKAKVALYVTIIESKFLTFFSSMTLLNNLNRFYSIT